MGECSILLHLPMFGRMFGSLVGHPGHDTPMCSLNTDWEGAMTAQHSSVSSGDILGLLYLNFKALWFVSLFFILGASICLIAARSDSVTVVNRHCLNAPCQVSPPSPTLLHKRSLRSLGKNEPRVQTTVNKGNNLAGKGRIYRSVNHSSI